MTRISVALPSSCMKTTSSTCARERIWAAQRSSSPQSGQVGSSTALGAAVACPTAMAAAWATASAVSWITSSTRVSRKVEEEASDKARRRAGLTSDRSLAWGRPGGSKRERLPRYPSDFAGSTGASVIADAAGAREVLAKKLRGSFAWSSDRDRARDSAHFFAAKAVREVAQVLPRREPCLLVFAGAEQHHHLHIGGILDLGVWGRRR